MHNSSNARLLEAENSRTQTVCKCICATCATLSAVCFYASYTYMLASIGMALPVQGPVPMTSSFLASLFICCTSPNQSIWYVSKNEKKDSEV